MKVNELWLREWVNPALNVHQIAAQLTMAGLEIESVTPVAHEFSQILIGHVIEVTPHPNADRLRVCQVNVGQKENLTIVCGGANVRANLKVPVAVIGATLQGQTFKTAKLRGVASQGMICSATELGLEEKSQGIMELPDEAPIGVELRDWLQLNDHIIDVHLTPNRGDCLSVLGIAREVALLNQLQVNKPAFNAIAPRIDEKLVINVKTPSDCPRYLGRVIRNINPRATTPLWLRERLRRCGLRTVHPVVDVTNYVLLELGHPLHAFDYSKIKQSITVRRAQNGETLKLLTGEQVELDVEILVIADTEKVLALAGIMGGLLSAVTEQTTDIFLESALFNSMSIIGRARRLGLQTDAAYRFERGVDAQLSRLAMERATQLLLEIVAGQPGPVTEVTVQDQLAKLITIFLRRSRITKILGVEWPAEEITAILHSLNMQVQTEKDGWRVTPPSYRHDIAIENDLIEEIARVKGYAQIPVRYPHTDQHLTAQTETQISSDRVIDFLVDRGYHQVITYSFTSAHLLKMLDPEVTTIVLRNPISQELSHMRTSLWPGLLEAALYNYNRQQSRVRLFEIGPRFLRQGQAMQQELMLSGLIMGSALSEQWGVSIREADFFDLKGDIETLFTLLDAGQISQFVASQHPLLHPRKAAQIIYRDHAVGYLGALHPSAAHALDVTIPIYLFELKLEHLLKIPLRQFKPFAKYPVIRRDISFWIDQKYSFQELQTCIKQQGGDYLQDITLFDIYAEAEDKTNKRSLALGLLLQHPEHTLVDDEVNAIIERVVQALREQYQIILRE